MDWDDLASSYGRQLWLERAALNTLLDLLDPRADERLLDVATGPAPLLQMLSQRRFPPAIAVGIDASPAMLESAPPLPPTWRLQLADATELPFDDGSFRCASASYLLHTLDPETRRAVLSECFRVLEPGGRLGLITIAPPRGRIANALTAPVRFAARRSEGRLVGLRPLDPATALAEAGFSEVDRRRSMRGYPSLCVLASKI